ncbi:MAG: PD40 domain-containing protein [Gemmatimonadetes bacterium]|nr:PD40 domain-containing protein [Gemmatimonadota bacterium]
MSTIERLQAALTGRYRIERELGAGGMATVYLAEDLRHDRHVALKVLKPELAAVLGAERFVVEIKTTAALQHPHILPLFDSGEADGFLYYVMPYVEGETLRSKLDRETQFSVEESVRITTQVADALDYAHRHGVIHRDIKPENILLHDGRPMVADFGIALALSAAAGGRMTETGLSLGTPHYMSPEQATAEKEITGRADVYSLASVLYEMLTGNPPHTGATAQQIIMKIIAEPVEAVTKFRKTVPPNVAAAVGKALEKLPADRFDSAKAFAEALMNRTWTSATFADDATMPLGRTRRVLTAPFIAACTVAAVAIAVASWAIVQTPERPISRFSLLLPDSQQLNQTVPGTRMALSPDGQTIVYVGAGGGGPETNRLWVRPMGQLRAVPLAGTERAANPSFSPDGKRIAYVSLSSPRALKVVPVAGGPALTLTDSLVDMGGVSWGTDGYIYYDGHLEGDGVARIRESGGKPEVASRPDSTAGEAYHFMPSALPNGRGVLFTIMRQGQGSGADVAVLDLRSGKHTVLVRGVAGRYSPSGHLLSVTDDGMLMAAPFDAKALKLTGDAVLVGDGLSIRGNSRVDLATSHDGTLTYIAGLTVAGRRELVWVERDGTARAVDSSWSMEMSGRPTLSPDGRMVAVAVGRAGSRQIWVKQLDRGPASKVAEVGWNPSWSPDGNFLVFTTPGGILQRVPADGSALPSRIPGVGGMPSLSTDGKWLLFSNQGDIAGLRTDGDSAPRQLVSDPVTQVGPTLSPDGRWLAYASDESGMFQVYVRPFPDTKVAKRQVSIGSGFAPRWSRSGREIFYGDGNADVWVADIAPGRVFAAGTPRRLFSMEAYGPLSQHFFDVSPDGRRFLFSRAAAGTERGERGDELIVVQNFIAELKAKAP